MKYQNVQIHNEITPLATLAFKESGSSSRSQKQTDYPKALQNSPWISNIHIFERHIWYKLEAIRHIFYIRLDVSGGTTRGNQTRWGNITTVVSNSTLVQAD
jgi:hypothetical protein